jgi:hypothetical protein
MRVYRWLGVFVLLAVGAIGCAGFGAVATKTVVAMDLGVKVAARSAVDVREAEIKALTGEAVAKVKELGCPGTDDAVKAACAEAKAEIVAKRSAADARWEKARLALITAAGSIYAAAIGVKAYLDGSEKKPDVFALISDAIKLYGALKAILEDYGVKDIPALPGM